MARPRLASLPARLQSVPQRAAVSSSSWRSADSRTASRGYGARWNRYRLVFLAANPLCVMCKDKGLITAANVVDHAVPHRGDMRLFWDEGNHQALCKPCHDSDKARQESESELR